MKSNKILALGMLIFTFLLNTEIRAQDEPKPVYITITTKHRNLDTDRKDWQKTEQEYYDKVTSKNELIIGNELLNHYYTANSSEVLFAYVYRTWEDIEKSNDSPMKRREKLFLINKEVIIQPIILMRSICPNLWLAEKN
jgi:hypothetical protein